MRRTKEVKNAGWRRSKHRIGNRASLKSLKRYCKEIWAEYIKERDGHICLLCGRVEHLNSHHMITAKCNYTRYEPNVGITLCAKCHELGIVSAHGTPWIIYEWLEKNRPEQYNWFLANRDKVYLEPRKMDIKEYQYELKKLLELFELNFPQVLKRSKYYTFTEEEEKKIIERYVSDEKASLTLIANEFNCGESVIKSALKRNNIKIRRNPGKHKGLLQKGIGTNLK